VEKAKTLLADASMRVSEVAFAVSFGSLSQFNNVFRRCLGVSPTQYRMQQRQLQN
jgi:AraC-like DNA-binding protein